MHKYRALLTLAPFLVVFMMASSCQNENKLISPNGSAQIQIALDFPAGPSESVLGKQLGTQAIDDVTISVLDAVTREVLINLQQLEIVFSEQFDTNVAQGELNIPLTGDFQTIEIIVFATDVSNNLFLSGKSNPTTLASGEIRQVPIIIALRAPNLVAHTGTVSASSVYQNSFPASLGIDFEFGTSWFSGGTVADGQESTYTWNAPSNTFISVCGIVNNTHHADAGLRTGYGFGTVTFQLYSGPNATGQLIFEETVDYPKNSALPFVKVAPLASGRSLRLNFHGPENQERGGFSELLIVSL